jgi:putative inorganic carbon (HCO3(-)) transporter
MPLFYLLITAMPLTRHPLFADVVGNLTLVKYLGGLCCGLALLRLAQGTPVPRCLRAPTLMWLVVHGVTLGVAYLGALSPDLQHDNRFNPYLSYFSFLMLLIAALVLVDSVARVRWVVLTCVASIALASLYVLREWQLYHGVYARFRPGWVVGDPNYFTISALLIVPVAYYRFRFAQARWERLLCVACLVVTIAAMAVSASRGGLIALAVAGLMIAWRSRQRARTLAMMVAVVLPMNLLAPASSVQRLLSPSTSDQTSSAHRMRLWRAGLEMVLDRPLTGVGLGNFKLVVDRYSSEHDARFVAHNTYVEIAAELGVVGLASFLAIIGSCYRALERLRRQAHSACALTVQSMAAAFQISLVSFLVGGFFVSAQYQKLFWLVVFVSMALPFLDNPGPRTVPFPSRLRPRRCALPQPEGGMP